VEVQGNYEGQAGVIPEMDFCFQMAHDQINLVIIHLNCLEATVQEHQSASNVSFGKLHQWLAWEFSILAQNLESL
jgi:hypothetical protein